MLRKALTTAVLLAATLAGTDARALPSARLSAATLDERIILANDGRGWGHHGQWRHKGFQRHGNSFVQRGRGFHRGNGFRRSSGFVARGAGGSVVVIVRPTYKSFRFGRVPLQPLIRNGSFGWRAYRW